MWFLPSKGRPLSLKRFVTHYNLTNADSEGVVWVDNAELPLYESIGLPPKWKLIGAPNPHGGTGAITNDFFAMFPDEPWYGLLADDVVPLTLYWDKELINAAAKDGLGFGDDGMHGPEHSSHFCVGGDLVRSLGWLALPGCTRTYIDDALMTVAKRRQTLRYLPDVKLEHRHFSNGKAVFDSTYAKPFAAHDKVVFDTWIQTL